jgi:hypothetical protein
MGSNYTPANPSRSKLRNNDFSGYFPVAEILILSYICSLILSEAGRVGYIASYCAEPLCTHPARFFLYIEGVLRS